MNNYERALDGVAKICHEANRAYCQTLGDLTQPSWENAPSWQKESAIEGVKFHLKKPRTVDDSHNNWMAHKIAAGWKYGPVKDADKKEHPCMVPFDELPYAQQFKDGLFLAIVMAMSPLVVNAYGEDLVAKMKGEAL